jgi:hypothetical protein
MLKKKITQFIYLFVNILFLLKYGQRQGYISFHILILIYVIFIFLYFKFIEKHTILFLFKKKGFIFLSFIVAITLITIIINVDGYSLNVDRWSAMHYALKTWLNGEYAYSASDHLNGRTSNFSGLLLIGLPFYLMGKVAFLQVFSFLLLSYTLIKTTKVKEAFSYVFLLLLSPAYWWEIFAFSDLLSNLIIIFCTIRLLFYYFKGNYFKKYLLSGIILSIVCLTRAIVYIPFTIFLLKDFIKLEYNYKMKFLVTFLLTSFSLILLFFYNCDSLDTLIKHNPLTLQKSWAPDYVTIITLLLPIWISLKAKPENYNFLSGVTLFFIVFLSFSYFFSNLGYHAVFFNHKFDLSYFTMCFPFIISEIISKNNPDENRD